MEDKKLREMEDYEFKRRLTELLWHPPKQTYASSSGGTYEDTDYYKWEDQILALFKEAGYAQIMPHKKRPDLIIGGE